MKLTHLMAAATMLSFSVASTHATATTPAHNAISNYANIAQAGYEDALQTAQALDKAIDALIATPSEATLKAARTAWLAARVPYQQTEVFRFGNPIVDEWEGKVNAWPLDEGMIDYVDAAYGTESDANAYYIVNVIANPKISISGKPVDASVIDAQLLREVLHEADGNEANVATGYHAIEFLLWGQDLNGTGPAPAERKGTPQERHSGNRPYTDYDLKNCTGGHCERRAQYLKTVSSLLVDDLKEIVAAWGTDGAARQEVIGNDAKGLTAMLTGLGSLSYGELAGERMKLGLLLNDPEEEHDCFADNTHNSHYYNQVGMQNVYQGRYTRVNGSLVKGQSLSDLIKAKDTALDAEIQAKLNTTSAAFEALKKRAETTETYDQMIAPGNKEGNATVQAAIDALVAQTRSFERAIAVLELGKIELEGSDSLDNPSAVFQ